MANMKLLVWLMILEGFVCEWPKVHKVPKDVIQGKSTKEEDTVKILLIDCRGHSKRLKKSLTCQMVTS